MGVQEGQGGGILKQFKNLKIKMRGDRNTLGGVDVVMRELERRESGQRRKPVSEMT